MCETNRRKINILVVFVLTTVQSLPIYNGFSVNFSPMLSKDEVKPKTFGALFAKVPQELPRVTESTHESLSQSILSNVGYLGAGCSNQIAKILFPSNDLNESKNVTSWSEANFINIPILKQPVDDYKILIAAAPAGVEMNGGDDGKPLIVYIVFPEGDTSHNKMQIPVVYFVNNVRGVVDMETKQKLDPILIVDHNRTVTKLKSNEISKFVKFKNKLINHYDTN